MIEGLIIMKYDKRSGADILVKYPDDKLEISDHTLMHVLNIYGFSKEAGLASLNMDKINFVSYYSGSDMNYFFILMLDNLEDPDDHEEALEDVSKIILKNIESNDYIEMLPSLYTKILENQKKKLEDI